MSQKNPIERRLDFLHDQWVEFAQDPDARLLCWAADADEAQMIDAFLVKEGDDRAGELPDLFLRIEVPFSDAHTYGYEVRGALVKSYEEAKEDLRADGMAADWQCPAVAVHDSDVDALLMACESLRIHHSGLIKEHLVLALSPASVSTLQPWQAWLERLAHAANDVNVRFIIVDDAQHAALSSLREQPRIHYVKTDLDMPAALEETSRQAGHLDQPGGRFRHLFVQLGNAVGKGDITEAERLGSAALEVVHGQGWHHLAVAVYFALGGAYLAAKNPIEAVERYRHAGAAAQKAEEQGEQVGTDLRLKAQLALAAALLGGGQYGDAARTYEDGIPIAAKLGDQRLLLECWRMASYCHEVDKNAEAAWACGLRGLEAGQQLDEEARRTSTLPYLGEGLLRLTKWSLFGGQRTMVEGRMEELLGRDWRPAEVRS